MYKFFIIFAFLTLSRHLNAQEKTNLYLLPGQGADCRLFSELKLDTNKYELICLSYGTPAKGESMKSYAQFISTYIDTTKPFILVGVSLGGMIATEIAHHLSPQKTFIISSAKHKGELPIRYSFQSVVPLFKIIPPSLLKKGALFLQPIVEPDRNKYKSIFISMLSSKSNMYFRRSIGLIINWQRKACTKDIIHIHGNKDHTIPLRNIENAVIVENGSHMMTLTEAEEISEILNTHLN